jgi:hypothetical protein
MKPEQVTGVVAAALLFVAPVGAAGQAAANDGVIGFGYTANAPEVMLGGSIWGLIPGLNGWGLYVDAKIDHEDPSRHEYYDATITAAQVLETYPDDEEAERDDRWVSFNAAVLKSVTNELILYAGGGWAQRDVYRYYLDPQRNRGQFGFYWVGDPDSSGGTVNIMAGVLLRASSRIRLQFGAETAPKGFTAGASVVLGGW